VLLTCLALTWLNPHVYLDTVFLLGSVAATHGETRWVFAAGAVLASFMWFFALALGARSLGRWLATPRAWRILDGIIAVVMLAIAVSLVLPHWPGPHRSAVDLPLARGDEGADRLVRQRLGEPDGSFAWSTPSKSGRISTIAAGLNGYTPKCALARITDRRDLPR
jgi:hypothetical protein